MSFKLELFIKMKDSSDSKNAKYLGSIFSFWVFRSRNKGRSVSFKKYVDTIMYEDESIDYVWVS